jgi:glycosyltransferase involved in cell wall biosynthesis
MQRWLSKYATLGLGCSSNATEALFGKGWAQDDRRRVYYCGLDPQRFAAPVESTALREALGVPAGRRVVAHVGRFEPLKNHELILQTARELLRTRTDVHFLFVGEGGTRDQMMGRARELGVADHATFTGARSDVPQILNGAVDAFMFPSQREGLPMSVVEAQTAGLPVVMSDVITPEVEVLAPLVQRLSLASPPSAWASALATALAAPRMDQAAARRAIEASDFNINAGVRELERMYFDGRP